MSNIKLPGPKLGPIKWCKLCGEKHPARERCGLVPVKRISKAGNEVKRMTLKKYATEA